MIKYVARGRIMIRQNESTLPKLRVKPSWRKDGAATLVHRASTPSPKRGVFVTENGPTFLKTYVIPVLLLNLAVGGWTLIASHLVQEVMVSLGYALIITVGLRLYLAYLDHYLR
jgi:hypothetical protein